MAVMEISVVPLGTRTPSISDYVSEAVKILEKEGLEYQLTAMGTIVEADLERLFDLALRMHKAVLDKGAVRVVTSIRIDDRLDKPLSMQGKIKSVQEKLK
jgi:uncharacterized protein (TIGR00106 family)